MPCSLPLSLNPFADTLLAAGIARSCSPPETSKSVSPSELLSETAPANASASSFVPIAFIPDIVSDVADIESMLPFI